MPDSNRVRSSSGGEPKAAADDSVEFLDADFLKIVSGLEDQCERLSFERLPTLGEKAPKCREALGVCLSLLHQVGSCAWGCIHEDHVLEYLVGRCTTVARGSLRLLQMGLYDESLALNRNLGEMANLLTLFANQNSSLEAWKAADDKARKSQFSPVRVRLALEGFGTPIIVNEDRYSRLSAIATHVTPRTAPQRHNPVGRPVISPVFQEAGFLLCLNELALPTVFVCFSITQLFPFDRDRRLKLVRAGSHLIAATGGVTVDRIDQLFKPEGSS